MTGEISRDLLVERLGSVRYDRFLFFLMGPYKSFNLEYVLDDEQRRAVNVEELPGPLRKLFRSEDEIDAAKALLRRVQGALRADPGVNAFLAVDPEIDVETVDAVTQSVEFARCSNATAFVVPFLGHNFGVGEEAGSVLEALADSHGGRPNAERPGPGDERSESAGERSESAGERSESAGERSESAGERSESAGERSESAGERLVLVHEDDVTSAMLQSARARWDLRILTYETEAELVAELRRFAAEVMHRERRGSLEVLD